MKNLGRKMTNRVLALCLAFSLSFGAAAEIGGGFSLSAYAEETAVSEGSSSNAGIMLSSADTLVSGTCGDNATWQLTSDGVLTISGSGAITSSPWSSYKYQIVSVIIEDGITGIGTYAFSGCTNLTSVTIPDSVTSIGGYAFSRCESLTSITIPDSVTSISYNAFYDCTSLTSITIPNSVTSIGDRAFYYCTNLTSITIPDSVTSIGDSAFSHCTSLTNITIPDGVTSIGASAFYYCTSLASITIPNSVTSIGGSAFSYCTSLTDVYFLGTEEEWNEITIGLRNTDLTDATIHFLGGSSTGSSTTGNYNVAVSTSETGKIQELFDDWQTAYKAYTEAVAEDLYESAAAFDSERNEFITQQVAALKKDDDVIISVNVANGAVDSSVENAVYMAFATYLYDVVMECDIDFNDLGVDVTGQVNLVKKIKNAMRTTSNTYTIDGHKVSINAYNFWGTFVGTITCDGLWKYYMCSTEEKCLEVVEDFLSEVKDLYEQSIYNAITTVCKEILDVDIKAWAQKKVSEKLTNSKLLSKIPSDFQFIVESVNTSYDYYNYVQKVISWSNYENCPESILSALQGVEFTSVSVSGKLSTAAWKKLDKAAEKLTSAILDYAADGKLDESLWDKFVSVFSCPVDVAIYNSKGTQIGYVGEDDIWYDSSLIYIEEYGGAKIVHSYTDDAIYFEITATAYGTLGCSFEEYDDSGNPIGRRNFYDIELYPGKVLKATNTVGKLDGTSSYTIISDGVEISDSEYILSTENGAVYVNCSTIGGGKITGDKVYVRGDAVLLRAVANEDYCFVGWYEDDMLVGTSAIYETTAKDNMSITAVFLSISAEDDEDDDEDDDPTEDDTDSTHTHIYDSGRKVGMYYVYTCEICGETKEVYYANDPNWQTDFWGLVKKYYKSDDSDNADTLEIKDIPVE